MKLWQNLTAGNILFPALVGFLILLPSHSLGETASSFSISLGFEFASGDYGTTQTSDSYSIPLTIGYYPGERFDFTLEIPYLYQSDSSTVSLGNNRVPTQTSSSPTGGQGMGGPGGGINAVPAAVTGEATTVTSSSQSGLGDISLTAGFLLITESTSVPMIRPLAYIKIPTADKEKGLGTGAFDFGGGLSVAKNFGNLATYVEALYNYPGTTSTYGPDNYLTYQGSLRYQLTQNLNLGGAVSGGTPAFAEASDYLEIQVTSSYRVSQRGSLGVYLGKGLTDSSPDYTTGFYGAISF